MPQVRSTIERALVVRYGRRRLRVPASEWVDVSEDELSHLRSRVPDQIEVNVLPGALQSEPEPEPEPKKSKGKRKSYDDESDDSDG